MIQPRFERISCETASRTSAATQGIATVSRNISCPPQLSRGSDPSAKSGGVEEPSSYPTGQCHRTVKRRPFISGLNVAHWGTRGSLEDWREKVGRKCCGNSRLLFLASCAFAGPLLALLDAESGGFHINGLTSSGKTTALLVAGSILGGGGPSGFLQTWRATANAFEAVAESHNDATLILDELAQVNQAEAVEVAYLLGNGFGKSRLNRDVSARRTSSWRLLFFSAGEVTLAMHAATVGKRARGGAGIRLINLDADSGQGLGLFENLHGLPSADDFARSLKRNALQYYGTPFRDFVGTLVSKREWSRKILLSFQEKFRRFYVPADASGEVRRAADRFALVAVAGELATRWGITGWNRKEALRAAGRCFTEWAATHGKSGSADPEAAIGRIRHLLESGGRISLHAA